MSRRKKSSFSGPTLRGPLGILFGGQEKRKVDQKKLGSEAEKVLEVVRKRYIVSNMRFDNSGVYLTVMMDRRTNEGPFDDLRIEMRELGLYPRLVRSEGEWVIVVYPMPPKKRRKKTSNLIMFILTLFTTVWAGAFIWMSRSGSPEATDLFTVLFDPVDMGMGGLTFALPLLLILGTHELGHYFTSRRYRVEASLPYFIPIPPFISPFGTFGALISMRENISNRKALVDIGAAGPIAGFIVAIPVTIVGLLLTNAFPAPYTDLVEGATYITFNSPLIFELFYLVVPVSDEAVLFPTAIAGWIGFLVTALNLLPVGQLDGGHIIRGVLGEPARFVSYGTVAVLVVMGFVTDFQAYLFFALLILLLGARHPPPLDDVSPLSKRQFAVAGFAVLMMALSFHPVPLQIFTAEDTSIEVEASDEILPTSPTYVSTLNYTVSTGYSGKRTVTVGVFHDGKEAIPSRLYPGFELDETVFSGVLASAEAFYDIDGWYLFLMGPTQRDVGDDQPEIWTFHSGCSPNKTTGDNISLTISFVHDGEEILHGLTLERFSLGLELDRTRFEDREAYRVNGAVHLFQPMEGRTDLVLEGLDALEGWEVVFLTGSADGNWTEPEEGHRRIMGGSDLSEVHLGSVNWTTGENGTSSAHFLLEFWRMLGEKKGTETRILLRAEGPGVLYQERSLLFKTD